MRWGWSNRKIDLVGKVYPWPVNSHRPFLIGAPIRFFKETQGHFDGAIPPIRRYFRATNCSLCADGWLVVVELVPDSAGRTSPYRKCPGLGAEAAEFAKGLSAEKYPKRFDPLGALPKGSSARVAAITEQRSAPHPTSTRHPIECFFPTDPKGTRPTHRAYDRIRRTSQRSSSTPSRTLAPKDDRASDGSIRIGSNARRTSS